MNNSNSGRRDSFSRSTIITFLLIAFGLAWGIVGLYIFLPDQMNGVFGELTGQHPLFYLAVYAPAIAALAVVYGRTGRAGTRRFLRRLLLWRAPIAWYVFLLFVVPILFYVGADLKGLEGAELIPVTSLGSYLVSLLLFGIKGPVEEIGWRGFALPMLQRSMSPLVASIVLGVIWAVWHFPAFLLSGTPQSSWSFMAFFFGTVALSTITTALFNASRGSILLAAALHWQLINPLWPDAQPYDTMTFVVAAAVIVFLNRKSMLSNGCGITEVVPPDGAGLMNPTIKVGSRAPSTPQVVLKASDAPSTYSTVEQ